MNDNEHTIAIKKHFCSFSEAIRAGVLLSPQAQTLLEDETGATCVIGAGLKALGKSYRCTMFAVEQLAETYPYLRNQASCPACEAHNDEAAWVAVCLNDSHAWSRERIADWLQFYEDSVGYVTLVESESSRSQTEEVSEMVMV